MKKFLLTILFCLIATSGRCADRYWVGGGASANWNATGNTNWGTASGTQDNASVPGVDDNVIFDNHANGNTPCTLTASTTINSLVMTGWVNTLTHNASVILTIDGQNGGGDSLILASGMTYTTTPATSRITFTGVGTSDITTAGIVVPNITFNNAGDTFQLLDGLNSNGTSTTTLYLQAGTFTAGTQTVTLSGTTPTINGAFTFYNLTRTGTAVKTDTLLLASNIVVTNAFDIDGNSSINRVLVTSNTLGTARTITLTGATVSGSSNVDFKDITFVGSPDFSGITGGSGDCGGNTGGTLTTADDWYWYNSGAVNPGNFSNYANWYTATAGGGSQMAPTRIVLPQDNAYFDSSSVNGTVRIDQDMPRVCATLDFTGVDAMTFDVNNLNQIIYGSIVLSTNVSLSVSAIYFDFEGRGSHTINSSSKTFGYLRNNNYSGTYTLLDNLAFSFCPSINGIGGSVFDADTYNVTASVAIYCSSTGVINMGSGTWTISGNASSSSWIAGGTINAETSTIVFGGTASRFIGGSKTYNNFTINSSATVVILGYSASNDTFNTLTINAPKTVNFTDGTDQTVSSLVAIGTDGNLITLTGTSTAGWRISDTTGTNAVEYCDISYSTAEGGATWNAYTTNGNVDSGNNSGWVFTDPGSGEPQQAIFKLFGNIKPSNVSFGAK